VTTPRVSTTTSTPTTSPKPAVATTTTRPKAVVTTAPVRRKTSSPGSAGCGQRAVTAGTFNPSCREYQGYLDPGTAGGRAPSSGELQLQYLCQTGQAPKSECP
jgi:hypothetical protein